MSQNPYVTAFNAQIVEFINDISTVFPTNVDILTAKNGITTLQNANKRMLIKIWIEHVSDIYYSEIMSGDIGFFIEKDYMKDINKFNTDSNKVIGIINLIRTPVKLMNDRDKERSMKYIQNLTKLADIYKNNT